MVDVEGRGHDERSRHVDIRPRVFANYGRNGGSVTSPSPSRIDTAEPHFAAPIELRDGVSDESQRALEQVGDELIIDLTVSPAVLMVGGVPRQPLGTERPSRFQRLAVRALDLLIAIPAFTLSIPIVLLLMVAIRFDSPGPALFASRRITRDGRFFNMWKLRTMVANGPEILAAHFREHPEAEIAFKASMKLEDDPRLTRLGRTLRRWSLDELPQLLNVIRGQMSIVGPRPLLAEEAERMGPAFPAVVRVKGGLTGLWQVSGRSTLTFEQRVPLDVQYVNERTLRSDLRILAKTVVQMLRGRPGAF